MKIFVCSSKSGYPILQPIIDDLESRGFSVITPNNYKNPGAEAEMRALGDAEHSEWKAKMIRMQAEKVVASDALLIVNVAKGEMQNYIGGAVLLEMYEAFRVNKPIYLWNPIPDNTLRDEIRGLLPIVINQDISKIK